MRYYRVNVIVQTVVMSEDELEAFKPEVEGFEWDGQMLSEFETELGEHLAQTYALDTSVEEVAFRGPGEPNTQAVSDFMTEVEWEANKAIRAKYDRRKAKYEADTRKESAIKATQEVRAATAIYNRAYNAHRKNPCPETEAEFAKAREALRVVAKEVRKTFA